MRLILHGDDQNTFLEGPVAEPLMESANDVTNIIEACFNRRVSRLLLYTENLTGQFFDLSSGEAGTILQKLRQYRIRLAVVRPEDTPPLSQKFSELMVEENRHQHFHLFTDKERAMAWLLEDQHSQSPVPE